MGPDSHSVFLRNEALLYLDLAKKARLRGDREEFFRLLDEARFSRMLLQDHLKDRKMFRRTGAKVDTFRAELEAVLFEVGL